MITTDTPMRVTPVEYIYLSSLPSGLRGQRECGTIRPRRRPVNRMWGKDLTRSAVRGGLLCLPLFYNARRVEKTISHKGCSRGEGSGGFLWLAGGIMMCRWADRAWINGGGRGGFSFLVFGPCVWASVGLVSRPSFLFAVRVVWYQMQWVVM